MRFDSINFSGFVISAYCAPVPSKNTFSDLTPRPTKVTYFFRFFTIIVKMFFFFFLTKLLRTYLLFVISF